MLVARTITAFFVPLNGSALTIWVSNQACGCVGAVKHHSGLRLATSLVSWPEPFFGCLQGPYRFLSICKYRECRSQAETKITSHQQGGSKSIDQFLQGFSGLERMTFLFWKWIETFWSLSLRKELGVLLLVVPKEHAFLMTLFCLICCFWLQ